MTLFFFAVRNTAGSSARQSGTSCIFSGPGRGYMGMYSIKVTALVIILLLWTHPQVRTAFFFFLLERLETMEQKAFESMDVTL